MTFDYIIIGAGSAGCVLANRLSAGADVRVLLLEAGGRDWRPEIKIPAAFSHLFKTAVDWNYETEPQPGCTDRRMYWPRGRVLGGSSSINAMIYMRGHRADYDGWAARGNPGWSYADLLPYFKRSEDNQRGACNEFHATGGPQHVIDLPDPNAMSAAFIGGFESIGVSLTTDFNGAEQDGVGINQATMRGARRWSAADAYLRPAMRRANLVIRTHAQSTRILFESGRARGVQFRARGKLETARAGREVILCGGAINSPQLLMLSGIGPAAELRGHGIDVVQDLPGVGGNLQDHLVCGVIVGVNHRDTLGSAESFGSVAKYFLRGKGPLASNVAEMCAFVRTRPDLGAADLQFHMAPGYFNNHGLGREKIHAASLGGTLLQPFSRGRVSLRSANPLDPPRIDPRYLTDKRDLVLLVEGLKIARQVFASSAWSGIRTAEMLPGPGIATDGDLAAFVRQSCETLYHPVGTCAMGPASDSAAVVDAELRVHGVEGLRVIDASVMPTVPRGNTNAPTMAIAEKAAAEFFGSRKALVTDRREV